MNAGKVVLGLTFPVGARWGQQAGKEGISGLRFLISSSSVSQTLMSWTPGSPLLFFPFLPWAGPKR